MPPTPADIKQLEILLKKMDCWPTTGHGPITLQIHQDKIKDIDVNTKHRVSTVAS